MLQIGKIQKLCVPLFFPVFLAEVVYQVYKRPHNRGGLAQVFQDNGGGAAEGFLYFRPDFLPAVPSLLEPVFRFFLLLVGVAERFQLGKRCLCGVCRRIPCFRRCLLQLSKKLLCPIPAFPVSFLHCRTAFGKKSLGPRHFPKAVFRLFPDSLHKLPSPNGFFGALNPVGFKGLQLFLRPAFRPDMALNFFVEV